MVGTPNQALANNYIQSDGVGLSKPSNSVQWTMEERTTIYLPITQLIYYSSGTYFGNYQGTSYNNLNAPAVAFLNLIPTMFLQVDHESIEWSWYQCRKRN